MTQTKKLYRTVHNKVIAGVAGGLAEYFDLDVVIFRLLFVLLVLFGGGGLLAYIVMWIVIPPQTNVYQYQSGQQEPTAAPGNASGTTESSSPETNTSDAAAPVQKNNNTNASLVAGILLIAIGVLFLINRTMPWVNLSNLWPLLLIIGGFLIIDPNILKSKSK
jgi:phage shock protein C